MLTSDFSKGERVHFGRGKGEKTLAEVVKVNGKTLKVKTLEVRGTKRTYPIGSVWTVGPSYVTKLTGSAKSAPVVPKARPYSKGDRVEFTFRSATLTGTIRSINSKTITVIDVSGTKYPNGVRAWPSSIIRKVGTAPAKPTAKLPLKIGQAVAFQGYTYTSKGETTVYGVVTKVNASKGSYEVYGGGYSRTCNLTPAQVTPVASRDYDTLVSEVGSCYAGLSPENLSCDGEASRAHVRATAARLNRAIKALSREAGREITEADTWKAYRAARAAK
ncbi:hypothetical protein N9917_00480 [Deltaproteobacteria bacterium]|nr:hypothetical protein [Deltaproteobacteria bacterium]